MCVRECECVYAQNDSVLYTKRKMNSTIWMFGCALLCLEDFDSNDFISYLLSTTTSSTSTYIFFYCYHIFFFSTRKTKLSICVIYGLHIYTYLSWMLTPCAISALVQCERLIKFFDLLWFSKTHHSARNFSSYSLISRTKTGEFGEHKEAEGRN